MGSMSLHMTLRDLVVFGGCCSAFGMELVNALDGLQAGGRHVTLPALAAALALAAAALSVRAALTRGRGTPAT